METAIGCNANLQKLNQAATSNLSVDFFAKEAPIANKAPGVAADPKIIINSLIGIGIDHPLADHNKPQVIETIIGFFTSPSSTR